MPDSELTLDQIYGPPARGGDEWHIDPKVQAKRDEEARQIIQAEYQDPRNPEKEATRTEYEHRFPGKPLNPPKELTLDDLYSQHPEDKGPGKTEKAPAKNPDQKASPVLKEGYWADRIREGKGVLRNAADLGDMVLSMPGGLAANAVSLAGQMKDEVMESFTDKGKTHRQIGKEAMEKNEELTGRWSTNVLARAVNSVVPEDGEVHSSDVEKAMGWLTDKIDKGATIIDKKTGGRLTKEEVQLEAQLFMNLAGTKGLVRSGGKLFTKDAAPKAKQASEGHTPDPEHVPQTPAEVPKEMAPEEFAEVQKAWKEHVDKKAEAQGEAVTQAKVAKRPQKEPALSKQSGAVSYDQVKTLGGLSLGFAAGAYLDEENPITGGVLGAIFGGAAGAGALEGGKRVYQALRSPDPRVRIDAMTEARQYEQFAGARETWQRSLDVAELLPKKEDRIAVFRAIDEGKVGMLRGRQKEAADIAEKFFKEAGEAATKEGVIDALRSSYVTHFWDKADAGTVDQLLGPRPGPNMGTKSNFNEARQFASVAEGKKAGLVPLTEDLAEVMGKYGDSITTTIANKRFLDRLKGAKNEAGDLLVRPAGKAPSNYVAINHPTLSNVRVHPEIAPSLRFMYEAQDANGIMAGLSAVNTALKRNAVSFSLFHAKALAEAMLGSTTNPLRVGKVVAQAALPGVFGKNKFLEQLRRGGAGDLVDDAMKHGLRFSLEGRESVDADVATGFYKTMKDLQQFADKKLGPVAGMPVRGYVRVNHAFDNFMWARLHAAMKLEVYAAKREALLQNSAKSGKPLMKDEAGKIAAEYSNTVFGGLNWQRIAEGVQNRFGRDMALTAFSPRGMRGLQLLMFAPDWTISTTRAFVKAFGKGSGLKGVISPRTAADLYRQQLLRSAFWYLTVGNAVNHYFSGHYVWENKDPTYIDLGDGRKMQAAKHAMEPIHWMDRPGQQALNKLGTIPSEALEQIEGKEYLSTHGAPPMKDRGKHLLKRAVPIGAGQFDNGVGAGVSGALGFPIYGKTAEQKSQEKKAAREQKFRERMKKLREQSQ